MRPRWVFQMVCLKGYKYVTRWVKTNIYIDQYYQLF